MGPLAFYRGKQRGDSGAQSVIAELSVNGIRMMQNNPALLLPLSDDQSIEVALFLLLAVIAQINSLDISCWLKRCTF